MNLLVVDDEYYVSNGIAEYLRSEIMEIDEIFNEYSVQGAKKIFEKYPVNIVITDVEMPEENGFVLLEWIRKSGKDTVFILLTGHKNFEYAYEAIKYNCLSYLVKPAGNDELKETVYRAIETVQKNSSFNKWWDSISQEEKDEYLNKDTQKDTISQIKKIIRENLSDPKLDRAFIAKQIFMNEDYMSNLFHLRVGTTLRGYIVAERIKLAEHLLLSTDRSINRIAAETGFSDSNYFNKTFRKFKGIAPNQYRLNMNMNKNKGI